MARKRIGELLLEQGVIDREQLEAGLAHHRTTGQRLGAALVSLTTPAPAHAQVPELKGFDHAAHAAGMQRRGKTLECAACHQVGAGGQMARFPNKKHQPCSDAGCHSPWPIPPKTKAEFETYCAICHRVDPAGKMDKKEARRRSRRGGRRLCLPVM